MVDKKEYLIQCLRLILESNSKEITQRDFEALYDAAYSDSVYSESPHDLYNKIIYFLFPDENVPWSFFDTPVGEVIGHLKFKDNEMALTDIAELLGCTIQYANKIIPELKARKVGKIWLVRESNFDAWLKTKGKLSLWELRRKKSGKVFYETQEEEWKRAGFETEVEYKY